MGQEKKRMQHDFVWERWHDEQRVSSIVVLDNKKVCAIHVFDDIMQGYMQTHALRLRDKEKKLIKWLYYSVLRMPLQDMRMQIPAQ